MPKVQLHYVINNGGDGSANVGFYTTAKDADLAAEIENLQEPLCENGPYAKTFDFDASGRLLNPSSTKQELLRELAEMRGEETDEEEDDEAQPTARAFNKAAEDPDAVFTMQLHYIVRNGGDGSASAQFFADAQDAQLASDIEDEGGEAFQENPHSQTLKFNGRGELLNPDSTFDELRQDLAERRGDDMPEEDETPAPAAATTAADINLAGKTVVFTGRLATMTRKQAESTAITLGAHVTDSVTRNTDILVAGDDAGSKLQKARALGVTIMTEMEWNRLVQLKASAPKPRAPGF